MFKPYLLFSIFLIALIVGCVDNKSPPARVLRMATTTSTAAVNDAKQPTV